MADSVAGCAAVEIAAVEKTYPNGTHALAPVNLTVAEGEFVTLLGPSGCGKSTLLKMVAGLLPQSSGNIALWGKPVSEAETGGHRPAERSGHRPTERSGHRPTERSGHRPTERSGHRVSFVFQEATLMPWARVQGNVRLPLDLAEVPRAEADARVSEALKQVGLEKFAGSLPRELSGGMQMRVSIARGLVTRPTLLLMDEPFGALDEITRNRLDSDLLTLWQAKKLTVIFVTHSIYEAVYLSNRVVVMAARPGRIVDEVVIGEPYPRDAAFRVSTAFSGYAKRLQDSLLRASEANDDTALA